ncbi:hypothetical protein DFP72DRAFT_930593 [Ephemerocybe angulata]|uniref:Uncharacterized protein n=1 Tax=Ephemerocybe angulata TaxID=980116 RepID=A0A8H6LU81_9AGAR|nr:hypothetical protein DFP72DRAFT_930593 [Tulosesus angulatus]
MVATRRGPNAGPAAGGGAPAAGGGNANAGGGGGGSPPRSDHDGDDDDDDDEDEDEDEDDDPDPNHQTLLEQCEGYLDRVISGELAPADFIPALVELGLDATDIEHWVDELEGRQRALLEAARGRGRARGPEDEDADRPPTPEGLEGEDLERFRAERDRARGRRARTQAEAVELMARRRLAERVGRMFGVGKDDGGDDGDVGNLELDKFMDSLLQEQERRRERSSSTLSPALLAGAPHLADLAKQAVSNPHIERTIRLRRLFASEKNSDNLVDVFQAQPLAEPLPRAIWKLIINDDYVDFKKLHAALDGGHELYEDAKDFGGGYALVKKEQLGKAKEIRTETEWYRVFGAWRAGVVAAYPHRASELDGYRVIIERLFRALPHFPTAGINVDADARRNYAKGRFRMDERPAHDETILVHMFDASRRAGGSSGGNGGSSSGGGASHVGSGANKRALGPGSVGPLPPSKRPTLGTICRNWNLGLCGEPCVGQRRHGLCIECGGGHKARDVEACGAALAARKRA